ncbi:Nif3-like dinuclear metal center hexameric protein [Suttonella ornithocola]|uniref:GTP cyclohydrolase 1 type 2 homolog n=1 Tax=Suttonella ornithocola TaxID=279832 RepID=A0A380MVM8_9GAMM|nr:Nif3-like dinuclear metal center hexameric protein [Suttonella ornithocola]SUO96615.1 metal-binding protein [Suttonella ornithocola]
MKNSNLITELNQFFMVKNFRDYAPNGLQVEGKETIKKILTAVSASEAAIDAAIANKADALFVHHGYFWKGEASEIVSIKRNRLKKLLENNINLIAYHLPLDQHPKYGNNILFGQAIEARNIRQSACEELIWHGEINSMTIEQLSQKLTSVLNRNPMMVGALLEKVVTKIAWCTGAAQDFLAQAVKEDAEVFISGEYAERTYHEAKELGIAYFSCGHHATERFGVKKMVEVFQDEFSIEASFFDEANPF